MLAYDTTVSLEKLRKLQRVVQEMDGANAARSLGVCTRASVARLLLCEKMANSSVICIQHKIRSHFDVYTLLN